MLRLSPPLGSYCEMDSQLHIEVESKNVTLWTYINKESVAVCTPRNFFEKPIELQTSTMRFAGFHINDVNERWRSIIANGKHTKFSIRWVFVVNDSAGNFIWIEHNMWINAFQWSCPVENAVSRKRKFVGNVRQKILPLTVCKFHLNSPCSCKTYTSFYIVHPRIACSRLNCEIPFWPWANHVCARLTVNIAVEYTPQTINACLFYRYLPQANGMSRISVDELSFLSV